MSDAGKYEEREPPIGARNWDERAYTVGIGGPVGRLTNELRMQSHPDFFPIFWTHLP